MGKYMRKAKTAADLALKEVAQSSLGVRTRARTLALQRLQKAQQQPVGGGGSYLQLRSRRLEKPQILVTSDSKQQKQVAKRICVRNPNLSPNSRLGAKKEANQENENADLSGGVEASFGENVVEFEGRERSTRESTPCSLIRDPESIRTPGSTTRPTCSTEATRRVQNSMPRHIPTALEMDDFFAGAEEQLQRQFIDKYNFDPVNDKPLPGRYEWVKLNP
ncbi:Cyclin-dependent kinase [Actinidia chinensis var. chinensis]|uniref:Cyclin-dependent kinase inhibitor n=1 Tax=Actinidia chinensis var. chinensis TaxID=1590841 RepID=A0A2R6PXK1_ACTCC|nr:Cyclin-dependent kinase [Actinidia chinensis var. chinensis]